VSTQWKEKMLMNRVVIAAAILVAASSVRVTAQSESDLSVIKGLAPVTYLLKTETGRAALGVNYVVTKGIQTGRIRQATLLPFEEQQQQALRDAFIASGNLADLADGLGTTLGSAYVARAHYVDRQRFTSVSPALADLIKNATEVVAANANSSKYFFANGTTDGKHPAISTTLIAVSAADGTLDTFGKAYRQPVGSPGAGKFGNARPFMTETGLTTFTGVDFFNNPASNEVYEHGPTVDLTDSPSYPSGHTAYGFTGALVLALLVPNRYQQMITRGAEYGNDRILMGAHYAMDVLAGRTLALFDMAHLLAGDTMYVSVGKPEYSSPKDFPKALTAYRTELTSRLQDICNNRIDECAGEDIGRFSDNASNQAFYDSTQTYGLPVVHLQTLGRVEDIGTIAPEAGLLLTVAFPSISLEEANRILTETEGPGGGFLDDGSAFGVYSRLNLYAASGRAAVVARAR
jgi:hypothetical protein